jgi:CDP-diglyceride synthetase
MIDNNSKWVRTLPLAMVSLASVIIAANLALQNRPYGWFLVLAFVLAWWVSDLLEKHENK